MQYILLIIIIALIVYILALRKRVSQDGKIIHELQIKMQKYEEAVNLENEQIQEDLNTIYLYASLSNEETQVQSLKEKQKVMMEICEKHFDSDDNFR